MFVVFFYFVFPLIKENMFGEDILDPSFHVWYFFMNGCLFKAELYWCEIMFFLSLGFEGLHSIGSGGLLWCSHLKLCYKYKTLWTLRRSYTLLGPDQNPTMCCASLWGIWCSMLSERYLEILFIFKCEVRLWFSFHRQNSNMVMRTKISNGNTVGPIIYLRLEISWNIVYGPQSWFIYGAFASSLKLKSFSILSL